MKIVAIAGTSGIGKTTIVKALRDQTPNSLALFMDDYTLEYDMPLAQLDRAEEWVEEFDFNKIRVPSLLADLQRIRNMQEGDTITTQQEQGLQVTLDSRPSVIFVELPLVLAEGFAEVIDLIINLTLPLELALHRRILRNLPEKGDLTNTSQQEYIKLIENLYQELEFYPYGRLVYIAVNQRVTPVANLNVDASKPIDEITSLILDVI